MPCSWQGWAVTALFVAVLVTLPNVFPRFPVWIPIVILVGGLGPILYLTRDTGRGDDRDQDDDAGLP
jgi:MFS superfamily sulfate permease-like transporter